MEILYGILIAIGALAALLLFKIVLSAALAPKKRTAADTPRKSVSEEQNAAYAEKLAKLLRAETIADGGHKAEFERFRSLLKEEFPLLSARAELKIFNGCLIYKIDGKNAGKNVMLMSHHDVVKAEGDWKHPPFAGETHDGALWGRGAVDTKTPLFSELQALEELLAEGFPFEGYNVYLGSSANEEICGDGIPLAVRYFKEQGIRFDAVLDEGGAVVRGMMPGVKRKCAMVAVHEKSRHLFTLTAESNAKGHLGLNPVRSNAVDRMSAFIAEVNNSKLFRAKFYPEVEAMFRTCAPYMSFPYRLLFSNFGLFRPLLLKILPLVSAQVGSMLGTNLYFTGIKGGESPQTQPKKATATAFFRCIREEDLEQELAAFRKIADRYGISVAPELRDYCRPFSEEQEQFKTLKAVLNENYPDAIVSPFLLTAGTDARHLGEIADCVLRFAPIDLSPEQFASVHNPNENISVRNVGECVVFYKDYVKRLCAGR